MNDENLEAIFENENENDCFNENFVFSFGKSLKYSKNFDKSEKIIVMNIKFLIISTKEKN